MSDRGPGRREADSAEFQTFRDEARTRSAALARLSSSETEAIEGVGRLFRHLRYSRGLSLPDVAARTDVAVVYLALMENGLLLPDELHGAFLARVGAAIESDGDPHPVDRGGRFASIAITMLRQGPECESDSGGV